MLEENGVRGTFHSKVKVSLTPFLKVSLTPFLTPFLKVSLTPFFETLCPCVFGALSARIYIRGKSHESVSGIVFFHLRIIGFYIFPDVMLERL